MRLLIAGDYCPKARGQKLVDSQIYGGRFKGICDLTKSYEYCILNFETNISTKESSIINKYGPNLTTTPAAIELIKYLGFNIATLANNHFLDYGEEAALNTMALLRKNNIQYVGAGNLETANNPLIVDSNGFKLAILNACEHEFSVVGDDDKIGSNGIDPIKMFYAIKAAKKVADRVLLIIHGGHEYYQLPSPRMQDWYRFFIDCGADVVINHHQHCFSGMELYNGKPIYYGLGNLFFDRINQTERSPWNEGFMVSLQISEHKIQTSEFFYTQCIEEPTINIMENGGALKNKFEELSEIISNRNRLEREFYAYCDRECNSILTSFEPYRGRIMRGLFRRGLLPSFISKRKMLEMRNLVECEAHRDKLLNILKTETLK